MHWHRPVARLVVAVLLAGLVSAGARLAEDDTSDAVLATAGSAHAAPGPAAEFDVVEASGWDKADVVVTTTVPEATTTTAAPVEQAAAVTTVPATTEPPAGESVPLAPPAPPASIPPVSTARIQAVNQLPVALDVRINGMTLLLPPNGNGVLAVDADPNGDGWGNDVVEVVVVGTDGCGHGDSQTWFEPGLRYVVTFTDSGQLCADGVSPGPTFNVQQGLSSTG